MLTKIQNHCIPTHISAHPPRNTPTQAHTYTDTQTETHTHRDTYTHTHKKTHTHTHTHAHTTPYSVQVVQGVHRRDCMKLKVVVHIHWLNVRTPSNLCPNPLVEVWVLDASPPFNKHNKHYALIQYQKHNHSRIIHGLVTVRRMPCWTKGRWKKKWGGGVAPISLGVGSCGARADGWGLSGYASLFCGPAWMERKLRDGHERRSQVVSSQQMPGLHSNLLCKPLYIVIVSLQPRLSVGARMAQIERLTEPWKPHHRTMQTPKNLIFRLPNQTIPTWFMLVIIFLNDVLRVSLIGWLAGWLFDLCRWAYFLALWSDHLKSDNSVVSHVWKSRSGESSFLYSMWIGYVLRFCRHHVSIVY